MQRSAGVIALIQIAIIFLVVLLVFYWQQNDLMIANSNKTIINDTTIHKTMIKKTIINDTMINKTIIKKTEAKPIDLGKPYITSIADKLLEMHLESVKNAPNKRTLCYVCHNLCGGYGDRFRGMLTVLYLAILTNSTFCSKVTFPFDQDLVFISDITTSYNLSSSSSSSKIRYKSSSSVKSFHLIDSRVDSKFLEKVSKALKKNDRVEIATNDYGYKFVVTELLKGSGKGFSKLLKGLTGNELAAVGMRLLIKDLVPNVKQYLERYERFGSVDFYGNPVKRRFSIHFRSGDSEMNHGSSSRHSDEEIHCFTDRIIEQCQRPEVNGSCSVFVSSDKHKVSDVILEIMWRNQINGYSIFGNSLHIDQPFETSVPGATRKTVEEIPAFYWKTISDWFLLFHKVDEMLLSNSGYSYSAYWMQKSRRNESSYSDERILAVGQGFSAYRLDGKDKEGHCHWDPNKIGYN